MTAMRLLDLRTVSISAKCTEDEEITSCGEPIIVLKLGRIKQKAEAKLQFMHALTRIQK
jgi:hypothetical protein